MRQWCLSLLGCWMTLAVAEPVVFTHVNGYTLDTHNRLQKFQYLVIDGDKVVEVGHTLPARWQSDKTVHIDMRGRTLLPGLIDAHGHIMGLGFQLLQLDVTDTKSAEDVANKVKAFAKQHPKGWLLGRGWNQENWQPPVFPSKTVLDNVSGDRPVWLRRIDGHAGWANSAALRLAGIDKNTPDPKGGTIVRDKQGEPTGILIDNAMALVESKIPKPTATQRLEAFKQAQAHLLSLGVTAVHDAGIDADTERLYRELQQANALNIRIYGMLSATRPDLAKRLQEGFYGDSCDWLSIRSIKAYADGALGSRGARLSEDYHDMAHHRGLWVSQPERLAQLITLASTYKFQINIHAIGDAANHFVLNELHTRLDDTQRKTLRPRIEHAQILKVEDIPRFRQWHIIASMQPTHATSDMWMAEKRLGKARLQGAYPWRSLIDSGAILASGTDFPVEPANPFYTWHAAVTRQKRDNTPPGGWLPKEKMSVVEAFKTMTAWSAYAGFAEQCLGKLQPGYLADFIVTDRDPFKEKPEHLHTIRVLETWTGGIRRF